MLHIHQYGIICPYETPDGGSIGYLKNLALLAKITAGTDQDDIITCLNDSEIFIPLENCSSKILNKVKTKKIFKWLKKNNIDDKEMLKTFNCGVGFCLIINPKNLNKITKFFTKEFKPYVIGKITTGKNKVKLNGKIDWS